MAEDSDLERTEPASPRRIEQAREKGQVARSRELTTFAVLLAAGGGLLLMGGGLMEHMSALMRGGLMFDKAAVFDPPRMLERLHQQSLDTLIAFLPFLGVVVVAAIASSMLLSGWLFTFQALAPDFSRLDPLKGIGRIFSAHSLIEMLKAVAKSALIGGVAVWVIWHNADAIFSLATESLDQAAAHLARLVGWTFMTIAGSMVLVVAIDVPFQLRSEEHTS